MENIVFDVIRLTLLTTSKVTHTHTHTHTHTQIVTQFRTYNNKAIISSHSHEGAAADRTWMKLAGLNVVEDAPPYLPI